MQDFKKGQKAILKINISPIRSYEITCTIKQVDADRIGLYFPEDQKELMKYCREGQEMNAVIYTDNGLYVFDSIIIESPFHVDFVIELPEETAKIQHRTYERTPISLNVKLMRNKKTVKTTSVNIGGGGIRFRVNDFFENNKIWNFVLSLPDGSTIIGYGEIIYSLKDGNQNVSVLKFIDINEVDRSRIIKLTCDEEVRNLIQKENSHKT